MISRTAKKIGHYARKVLRRGMYHAYTPGFSDSKSAYFQNWSQRLRVATNHTGQLCQVPPMVALPNVVIWKNIVYCTDIKQQALQVSSKWLRAEPD